MKSFFRGQQKKKRILIHQELTATPLFRPCKKVICKQSLHEGRAPEIVLGNCLSGIWKLSGFTTKRKEEAAEEIVWLFSSG